MRAVVCRAFGPVESLELAELPPPVAGPQQAAVRVCVAGVNFPDALTVEGRHQRKPPLPFIPGSEVAGVVTALGPAVPAEVARVGQRVYAGRLQGAFAEQVVVDAGQLRAMPAGVSFEPFSLPPDPRTAARHRP